MAYPPELLELFSVLVNERGVDECWPWHDAKARQGRYGGIGIKHVGATVAHRVAYEYYKGDIPDGLIVRHKCDFKPCVNPNHLELGTQKDNVRDAVVRGRWTQRPVVRAGVEHHNARITEDDVREIRRAYAAGETSKAALARTYGMSATALGYIISRRNWKHVD